MFRLLFSLESANDRYLARKGKEMASASPNATHNLIQAYKSAPAVFPMGQQMQKDAVKNYAHPVSGTINENGLKIQLANDISKMLQNKIQTLTYMSFDLQAFKSVNDTYGHNIGDKVLKDVSELIDARVTKNGGKFFHLHGDEMAVLFVNIDQRAADVFYSKLLGAIDHYARQNNFLQLRNDRDSRLKDLGLHYGSHTITKDMLPPSNKTQVNEDDPIIAKVYNILLSNADKQLNSRKNDTRVKSQLKEVIQKSRKADADRRKKTLPVPNDRRHGERRDGV